MKYSNVITVETTVKSSLATAWDFWTKPAHIVKWNFASDDWHCPSAENNLSIHGKFSYHMAAKDGSFEFDFWGTYTNIIENELIEILLGDNRKIEIVFRKKGIETEIIECFEAEMENPLELQKNGWQQILNNYKKYLESSL